MVANIDFFSHIFIIYTKEVMISNLWMLIMEADMISKLNNTFESAT